MKRREFVAVLGSAVVAWPLAARAQEAGRTYQIGGLSAGPRSAPYWLAVFDELRRAGFIEGQNVTIDWHQYGSRVDLIPEFATELVKAKVDVIVATGDSAIRTVQQATTTIPILGSTDDMVGSGVVNSLARPDGNITGTSLLSTELDGKRLEILIEALPGLRHMAALADSKTTAAPRLRSLQNAAQERGIELSVHQIAEPDEIPDALEAGKDSGAAAINVLSSPLLYGNRQIIIQRVATLRLPAIYNFRKWRSGLIGYGPSIIRMFRELVAPMLIKLLHGAKPAGRGDRMRRRDFIVLGGVALARWPTLPCRRVKKPRNWKVSCAVGTHSRCPGGSALGPPGGVQSTNLDIGC
jgi:putative ABC transport system substrate-binding protein